jgi:hypothetical protein
LFTPASVLLFTAEFAESKIAKPSDVRRPRRFFFPGAARMQAVSAKLFLRLVFGLAFRSSLPPELRQLMTCSKEQTLLANDDEAIWR